MGLSENGPKGTSWSARKKVDHEPGSSTFYLLEDSGLELGRFFVSPLPFDPINWTRVSDLIPKPLSERTNDGHWHGARALPRSRARLAFASESSNECN